MDSRQNLHRLVTAALFAAAIAVIDRKSVV